MCFLGDLYGKINAQRGILFQEDQVGKHNMCTLRHCLQVSVG